MKTRVWKAGDHAWRVEYVLPYSGRLYVDLSSWDLAYAEACKVEENRMWT